MKTELMGNGQRVVTAETIADKLKSVSVKINPPRHSREYWLEKAEVGSLHRGLSTLRGIGRSLKESAASQRRYAKGFAKLQGLCKTCGYFDAQSKVVGGHCLLKEQENCVK